MSATTEQFEVRNRYSGAVQFTATISVTPDMLPSVKLGLAVKWAVSNGANLSDAYLRDANLRDANLRGAYLRGAYLRDAYLSDANLRGANLRGANLRGAYLRDANLSDANLRGAYLRDANLSDANLRDANLSDANLRGAYLRDANLSDAYLRGAYLRDANLRPIKADFFMILALGHKEVPNLVAALRDGRVDGSTYDGECACLVGTLDKGEGPSIPHDPGSPAESWFAPIRKGTKPGDEGEGGFRSETAIAWALEYCAATGIELTEQVPA